MTTLSKPLSLLLPLALSGCIIGNGHICGPQTPMADCDREAYQRLVHPPSAMEEWQHPARAPAERLHDWMACGGTAKGSYTWVSASTDAETVRLSGEKFDQIQRCMMGKGYHYTGTCDGEIPSQFPACQHHNGATPQHS